MKIYNYDKVTNEFLYESDAKLSPADLKLDKEVHRVPSFATKIKPPKVSEFQAAVFIEGEWAIVPDYRDAELYIIESGELTNLELGEPLNDSIDTYIHKKAQDKINEVKRINDINSKGLSLIRKILPYIVSLNEIKFGYLIYSSINVDSNSDELIKTFLIYEVTLNTIANGTAVDAVAWPV